MKFYRGETKNLCDHDDWMDTAFDILLIFAGVGLIYFVVVILFSLSAEDGKKILEIFGGLVK